MGTLRFGAARGPKEWDADRPWQPGYWADSFDDPSQLEAYSRSKRPPYLLVPTECIEGSVQPGERVEVFVDGEGVQRCVRFQEVAEAEPRPAQPRRRLLLQLAQVAQAGAPAAAIALAAAAFSANRPQPSFEERQERCRKLMAAGVASGDRPAAEKWVPLCELPEDQANALLESMLEEEKKRETLSRETNISQL